MPVIAHFDLQVEPARLDDALAVLRRILVDTRSFPGCQGVTIAQADDDPAHVLVVGSWASAAAHDAYLAWRSGDGAVADLPPLLAADPSVARFAVAGTF